MDFPLDLCQKSSSASNSNSETTTDCLTEQTQTFKTSAGSNHFSKFNMYLKSQTYINLNEAPKCIYICFSKPFTQFKLIYLNITTC